MRIYRRSLCFLLLAAVSELFPEARLIIEYGLNFGALSCQVEGRSPFMEAELALIEARMCELVEADVPIVKQRIPVNDYEALMQAQGSEDTIRLLRTRRKPYVTVYTLNGYRGYMHGYMVPSAGYLKFFGLAPYSKDFVLRYPRSSLPSQLQPIVDYPQLVRVFNEYGDWMDKLEIRDVGTLNTRITNGHLLETVLVGEALQEQRVAQIATLLSAARSKVKVVLISGPSSSGKTTFSKRLAIQLMAHGIRPIALGLDDFLVERARTPLDEEGDYDYESLYAEDLELLNSTLLRLMRGETATLPHYNFLTGGRERGETASITDEHMVILEGIHGMNPELVPHLPPESVFRIYVSALTQLNLDRHNRVATTDTRLLRRIIRDARHRGYTAKDTISRWPKVRRGEYKWIFPYQENADVMFNSALVYELAVIKPLAEPLLLQIEPGRPEHIEAKRLLSFLQWFEPCPADLVPPNSILREFIDGSLLASYTARG